MKSTTIRGCYYSLSKEGMCLKTYVAGAVFADADQTIESLTLGDPLHLEREPHNPHDPNAISVRTRTRQIGFIRADLAEILAPLMDHGLILDGEFNGAFKRSGFPIPSLLIHCSDDPLVEELVKCLIGNPAGAKILTNAHSL